MRRHASLNLCTDRYRDPPKNHFFNTIGAEQTSSLLCANDSFRSQERSLRRITANDSNAPMADFRSRLGFLAYR